MAVLHPTRVYHRPARPQLSTQRLGQGGNDRNIVLLPYPSTGSDYHLGAAEVYVFRLDRLVADKGDFAAANSGQLLYLGTSSWLLRGERSCLDGDDRTGGHGLD